MLKMSTYVVLVRVVCKVNLCFWQATHCSGANSNFGNSDERASKKR